ncbi:MAG: hypothetical protein WCJ35_22540 [Planctomycetota bacterium]
MSDEAMTLPIPFLTSRALATTDAGTRESFRLFEALVTRLEPAMKREMRFSGGVALEFPQLAASYLFSSLQRVRVVSWGVISAINAPNEALFVLAVRSMLESAANLAYLRANIVKTYAGELSRKEMTYLSLRMKFATRKPDDMELSAHEASCVSSVNVLTAIKALDRFATAQIGFANEKAMTNWYERLCEFAHPNCLGNSVGSESDYAGGMETFDAEPCVRAAVLEQFGNYAYVSLYAFCRIYNDSWRMLVEHGEVLPTWEPLGDPVILLD